MQGFALGFSVFIAPQYSYQGTERKDFGAHMTHRRCAPGAWVGAKFVQGVLATRLFSKTLRRGALS
jgi:hypothetical protein